MIAVREAWQAGLFQRCHWLPNVISGLIVGVVALPLAMAFAIASGAKPEQGLYTAIIAGFCVSAFGGSRLQIAGPTGAFIAILSGITLKYGVAGLQTATFMAGVMLLLIGIFRLGSVIRLIPEPVIAGFTAGIGIIIWVSQWQAFFGLPAIEGAHFHEKLLGLIEALPHLHPATTLMALASLGILILWPRLALAKRLPAPLLAMVMATIAQSLLHLPGVATIGTAFGGIPMGLPVPQLPDLSPARLVELAGPAFSIAMLGAIESLLSAVVADAMAGTTHNSNQELIGQGIANILAPVFGGFAATGAIARTATNVRSGGTGPLAGITHSALLALIVLALSPLAANIPLAALAAILFVVAFNMSDARNVALSLRHAPRKQALVLALTLLVTVFVDLVWAVGAGMALAFLLGVRPSAAAHHMEAGK